MFIVLKENKFTEEKEAFLFTKLDEAFSYMEKDFIEEIEEADELYHYSIEKGYAVLEANSSHIRWNIVIVTDMRKECK